jgi:tetratricopeptide (TPR) repeat protein
VSHRDPLATARHLDTLVEGRRLFGRTPSRMAHRNLIDQEFSRRTLLRSIRFAPVLLVPSPIRGLLPNRNYSGAAPGPALSLADFRVKPNYPNKSDLDNVLRLISPGSDEYITEKYAFEIISGLNEWSRALKSSSSTFNLLGGLIHNPIQAAVQPVEEIKVRSRYGIKVSRSRFSNHAVISREQFLSVMNGYLGALKQIDTAEFEITSISTVSPMPQVKADIRYTFVGTTAGQEREQRTGLWTTEWIRDQNGVWKAGTWIAIEETVARLAGPGFVDITAQALGATQSYKDQLLRGVDYWRTVLDGACGIDVYGNNGLAVGDYDNDGFDDIYICQTAGLPNRLYRNLGDGSFEDVTRQAGLDVLDSTSCALFADFENKGFQDLLVVTGSGPLLFLNQGNGKFLLRRDAFKFARAPQGSFTHAALADYDRDGRLDVYFCLYNYYAGLDQYRYPSPYFDARNGPPNFLFHNLGGANFEDRTEAAGLNAENDRYSFACAWGDYDEDGWPDLYVANDFGKSNLYRNNRDGTFSALSSEAGVNDVGAGMSACWLDYDGDGRQDIYVGNMWSAAGMRVSQQEIFHKEDAEEVRTLYRRHACGNSLYKNQGGGKFSNVSTKSGTDIGRWAWSCDSWDFDQDGLPDLYIANGYISGTQYPDLASFFWRQLVARSPRTFVPSPNYERGWNAINELIRSDASWNGFERNVLYLNNEDGTFSDISGPSGLDFTDDARAFALADLDHDGKLEIILKNRTAPQVRVLRNAMRQIGNSVIIQLRGTRSNRDAIGAAVTIETGELKQTKYVQAGSGFLSQHSKELHFGLGDNNKFVLAVIHWPNGDTQKFELSINTRVQIIEGSMEFREVPFANPPSKYLRNSEQVTIEPLSGPVETWLLEPFSAPDFSLPDAAGKRWQLSSFRGKAVFLTFCATGSRSSQQQLRNFSQGLSKLLGVQVLAVKVDDPQDASPTPPSVHDMSFAFPVLLASADVTGTYNLVFRYLFDRRRDLGIPTSFLVDKDGLINKVYQGIVRPESVADDVRAIPQNSDDRIRRGLPFPGALYLEKFQRNAFTYGVAFFQHGYFDQAAESFRQVIAAKPQSAEAHYNLGTLHLRRDSLKDARLYLEKSIELRPNYPEAWNNLGMLAAEEGNSGEAVKDFKQCLSLRPDYAVGLVNLGNVYRRQKAIGDAEQVLSRALRLEPDNAEANYSMGMLYGQQDRTDEAEKYLMRAVILRPTYVEALNNLGVILVREQRYDEAKARFQASIQANPNFDQAYLNLARVYLILNDRSKARETLEALLRLQPQHKMAQQALGMLQ